MIVLAAAADTMQNALDPAAREAAHIAHLWWLYFWVLITIFAIVAVFLFFAILRSRRQPEADSAAIIDLPAPPTEKRV